MVLRRRARTFGVILCNTMTCRYSFQNSMVSIPMCFAGLDKFVMIVKRSDMKTFSQRRTYILYKDLKGGNLCTWSSFWIFVKLWDMWFLTWNGPDSKKLRENQVAQRPESLCMRSASVFSISRGPYENWYLETRFFLVFSVRKFRIIVPFMVGCGKALEAEGLSLAGRQVREPWIHRLSHVLPGLNHSKSDTKGTSFCFLLLAKGIVRLN